MLEQAPLSWSTVTLTLGVWFVAVLVAAGTGNLGLSLPALTFGPLLLAWLSYRRAPRVRRLVEQVDLRSLVALHATRTVGLGFLFLAGFGVLPGVFAWPAGLGDAISAVGALGIVLVWLNGRTVSRRTLLWWNAFGLADFLVAVTIGTLARSIALGGGTNTDAMGSLPLVLFPAFVVPFFAITHLAVLAKVRSSRG